MNLTFRSVITNEELNKFIAKVNVLSSTKLPQQVSLGILSSLLADTNIQSTNISSFKINPSVNNTETLVNALDLYNIPVIKQATFYCDPLVNHTEAQLTPTFFVNDTIITTPNDACGMNSFTFNSLAVTESTNYKLIPDDLNGASGISLNKKEFNFASSDSFGLKQLVVQIPMIRTYTLVASDETDNHVFYPGELPADMDGSGGMPAAIGIQKIVLKAATTNMLASDWYDIACGMTRPGVVEAKSSTTVVDGYSYKCIAFREITSPQASTNVNFTITKSEFWNGGNSIGTGINSLNRQITVKNTPECINKTLSFNKVLPVLSSNSITYAGTPTEPVAELDPIDIKLNHSVDDSNPSKKGQVSIKFNDIENDIIIEDDINITHGYDYLASCTITDIPKVLSKDQSEFKLSELKTISSDESSTVSFSYANTTNFSNGDLLTTFNVKAEDESSTPTVYVDLKAISASIQSRGNDAAFILTNDAKKGFHLSSNNLINLNGAILDFPIIAVKDTNGTMLSPTTHLNTIKDIKITLKDSQYATDKGPTDKVFCYKLNDISKSSASPYQTSDCNITSDTKSAPHYDGYSISNLSCSVTNNADLATTQLRDYTVGLNTCINATLDATAYLTFSSGYTGGDYNGDPGAEYSMTNYYSDLHYGVEFKFEILDGLEISEIPSNTITVRVLFDLIHDMYSEDSFWVPGTNLCRYYTKSWNYPSNISLDLKKLTCHVESGCVSCIAIERPGADTQIFTSSGQDYDLYRSYLQQLWDSNTFTITASVFDPMYYYY